MFCLRIDKVLSKKAQRPQFSHLPESESLMNNFLYFSVLVLKSKVKLSGFCAFPLMAIKESHL